MSAARTSDDDASTRGKWLALLEVTLAGVLMHVAFRVFKRCTALGQLEWEFDVNYSPGFAMLVIAFVAIRLRHRTPAEHGITCAGAVRDANRALVCILVVTAVAAIPFALGVRKDPRWGDTAFGITAVSSCFVASSLILWIQPWSDAWIARIPKWTGIAFAVLLPCFPIVVRLAQSEPVGHTAAVVLSIVFGSAFAESVFFHGYVQSRLNQAFGRRWCLRGVAFGPALFITALLFGVVHLLNTYDYLTGEGELAWWWGASTAVSFYFGILREKTGSIVATTILHAFVNFASLGQRILEDS